MTMVVFQESLYGEIRLPHACSQVIHTPSFFRLQFIRKLGPVSYIFPHATHTCYEHSIGVSYLCHFLLTSLARAQPELGITETLVKCFSVAGLCHNLGVGPFTSAFEQAFPFPHLEPLGQRSAAVVRRIVSEHFLEWSPEELDLVSSLLEKTGDTAHWSSHVLSSANSVCDLVRLDSMLRDAHRLNCPTLSVADVLGVLSRVRVCDSKLAFDSQDIPALHRVVSTQNFLFTHFHQCKEVLAARARFAEFLRELVKSFDVASLLLWTDACLFSGTSDQVELIRGQIMRQEWWAVVSSADRYFLKVGFVERIELTANVHNNNGTSSCRIFEMKRTPQPDVLLAPARGIKQWCEP